MQKKPPVEKISSAPDPFPNKSGEPFRLRLLALTDAKLTHGEARLFSLLIDWSFLLTKGGDGHGQIETTTRELAAAMGCNKDYVTKWQRKLAARKYILADLVPCGRGLKRFRFRIVGMHQNLSPEVGTVDGNLTVPRSGDNKVPRSGDDKIPTTGDNKVPTTGDTLRRQEKGRQETGSPSGTVSLSKTVKSAELLKSSARSAAKRCEAPGKKKQTDTAGENEFLAMIVRLCGNLEGVNWGGRWRNRYRGKNREKWLRVWRDIASMAREGNPPEIPWAYAEKLFREFAD